MPAIGWNSHTLTSDQRDGENVGTSAFACGGGVLAAADGDSVVVEAAAAVVVEADEGAVVEAAAGVVAEAGAGGI